MREFLVVSAFSAVALLLVGAATAEEPLLESDILPILTKNCMGCHGGLKQEGGLDLRTLDSMLSGGDTGPALARGKIADSELWQRIAADEMPPGETKLSSDEKEIIRQWITAGLPTIEERRQGKVDPLLPAGKRHEPQEVAAAIDRHIGQGLAAAKLTPNDRSDDAEFLRRVYLDLTGRVPTADQAKAFLDDTNSDKRARLIDVLLATPEYGEHFGRTWRDWISPPELPSDMNSGKQPHNETREFGRWLGERFAAGDTWDKIVTQILTVEGEIKNQPQVIFFGLVGQDGKETPDGSARAVAKLFMGVQMQCAQCHDDPYRDLSQAEHWALASFFVNTSGDFKKINESNKEKPRIAIPKDAFVNAGKVIPAAYYRGESVSETQKAVQRKHLVDWLTARDNPFFARAFANRLWFQMFARGIVNPVDDFRPLNPPSHPGLIKLLENEFAASGFDVKHLVRCICNSEAYQRTSRIPAGASSDQTKALTANFGRIPLRIMTADMLYDSLKLAYHDDRLDLRAIDPQDGNTNGESSPVGDEYLEFLRKFETNEEDTTDFNHGIPQMLAMINHPRLLTINRDFENHAKDFQTPEQAINTFYLATLSRRPTDDEMAAAVEYVGQMEEKNEAYVGVLWSLVNRSEYLFVR